MNRKDRRHSPLKKALAILIYICDHRSGATLEDLIEKTGSKRRNVYRYLQALNDAGARIVNISPSRRVKAVFRLEGRKAWANRIALIHQEK
jgi:predicted DNA-binding transcriptional regulator YafY